MLVLLTLNGFTQEYEVSTFHGRVATSLIEAELYNINNKVNGWYKYPTKSVVVFTLEGKIVKDSILLTEYNGDGNITGYFYGLINNNNSILGIWRNADKTRKYQFSFLPTNQVSLINQNSRVVLAEDDAESGENEINSFKLILWGSIIILVLILVLVIIIVRQNKKNKDEVTYSEVEVNEESAITFHNYVESLIKKNPNFFKITSASSGKEVEESNSTPDFLVQLKSENETQQFAVECKYRSTTTSGRVNIIKSIEQFDCYMDYAVKNNAEVFIALGVGGSPNKPFQLYMIPLNSIEVGTVTLFDYSEFAVKKRDYLF